MPSYSVRLRGRLTTTAAIPLHAAFGTACSPEDASSREETAWTDTNSIPAQCWYVNYVNGSSVRGWPNMALFPKLTVILLTRIEKHRVDNRVIWWRFMHAEDSAPPISTRTPRLKRRFVGASFFAGLLKQRRVFRVTLPNRWPAPHTPVPSGARSPDARRLQEDMTHVNVFEPDQQGPQSQALR